MQHPSVGRIVHFYPNQEQKETTFKDKLNGAEFLPAIVTQSWNKPGDEYEDLINISVFTPFHGMIGVGSVRSAKNAHTTDGTQYAGYWEWPPRV
jgi:hypothetical protein